MTNHRIRIGGKQFILATTEDTDSLKRQIMRAIHSGGGFVTVRTAANEDVQILMTAQIAVWFEETDDTTSVYPLDVGELVPTGYRLDGAQVDYDDQLSELAYAF